MSKRAWYPVDGMRFSSQDSSQFRKPEEIVAREITNLCHFSCHIHEEEEWSGKD